MESSIIDKLQAQMDAEPCYKKLKRTWKINKWILNANIQHYKNWIKSKKYRLSYGDCDCFKGLREIDEKYCEGNPKCSLKKCDVSFIDSF